LLCSLEAARGREMWFGAVADSPGGPEQCLGVSRSGFLSCYLPEMSTWAITESRFLPSFSQQTREAADFVTVGCKTGRWSRLTGFKAPTKLFQGLA